MEYFVHKSSYVDDGVKIGKNTKIWHFCHIQTGSTIGDDCSLGQNVYIGNNVSIGNNVKIQNNVSLYDGLVVEDDVFIGPSVVFTNVINPRSFINRKSEFKTTVVRKGATLGANSTIICGVEIGKYSFVGAGSVVTKNTQLCELVYGVPSKSKGYVCLCGTKLTATEKSLFYCSVCKKVINFSEI